MALCVRSFSDKKPVGNPPIAKAWPTRIGCNHGTTRVRGIGGTCLTDWLGSLRPSAGQLHA